jgi:hypothetical protein
MTDCNPKRHCPMKNTKYLYLPDIDTTKTSQTEKNKGNRQRNHPIK